MCKCVLKLVAEEESVCSAEIRFIDKPFHQPQKACISIIFVLFSTTQSQHIACCCRSINRLAAAAFSERKRNTKAFASFRGTLLWCCLTIIFCQRSDLKRVVAIESCDGDEVISRLTLRMTLIFRIILRVTE